MAEVTLAEVCVVACAEAWRGDGEILASPMGLIPTLGCRLAKLTFAPDLLISDGEAYLLGEVPPVGAGAAAPVIEGWLPYRAVFDVVASGRRHVMMGASQMDRFGNSNISCIGDWVKPKAQLLGVRGGPGNTVNHATSYWVPKHSRRVFVPAVDMVSGIGTDRARAAGGATSRFHDLRVVVTDKAVFDATGPDGTLRLRSLHPGVTVQEVQEATGFSIDAAVVGITRLPTAEELTLIRTVLDPDQRRDGEVRS
jgi:acyl CoA:acetate/3-ketoacid CoA transferase beta subunit